CPDQRRAPCSTHFPYTTLFRSPVQPLAVNNSGMVYAGGFFNNIGGKPRDYIARLSGSGTGAADANWNPSSDDVVIALALDGSSGDRKSTRLNSSHVKNSYAVIC